MSELIAFAFLLILLAFIFIRIEIAFALALVSILWMAYGDYPLQIIASQAFTGMDQFVLVAIPFFLLLGELMNNSQITDRLIRVANVTVGRVRGGLAQANVGTSFLFAGISGATVADVAALGSIFVPSMAEEGYPRDFSAAVTAASSLIGPIIPPSIILVIYGGVTQTSIGGLFAAAIVPGILLAIAMMTLVFALSFRREFPKFEEEIERDEYPVIFGDSVLALTMPVLILVLIVGVEYPPTEAAAVACVYAFVLGVFVYRTLDVDGLHRSLHVALERSAQLYIIIGFALVLTWILARERIPHAISEALVGLGVGPVGYMLIVVVVLLLIGTFLEIGAATIMLAPTLAELASIFGIEPLQFGLVLVLALCYGLITPPVGICLFAASSVSRTPVWAIAKQIVPFFLVNLVVLLLIVLFPELTLYLPERFGFA